MNRSFVLLLAAIFSCAAFFPVWAQKPKPGEYTSRAEVAKDENLDRDFQIQGEYLGRFDGDGCGVNVVADGNGKFRFIVFEDGLPGDSWKRGKDRIFCEAALNNNGDLVVIPKEEEDDGKRKPVDGDDAKPVIFKVENDRLHANENYSLRKLERKSSTLGQKAPEGAVILFADGKKNESMWNRGNINEEAGTLWAEAETKPLEKRPHTMHLEFMLSYMPTARGQARANSGVYIDQAYECQVLDSFGLEGKNNECGGFYQLAEPIVNMCFPPLQWQTYDIEFVPAAFDAEGKKTAKAKITIRHNGVVIHDGIEPEKETPGCKKEGPEARGLYLQGHGNKVQYRNIWVKYGK